MLKLKEVSEETINGLYEEAKANEPILPNAEKKQLSFVEYVIETQLDNLDDYKELKKQAEGETLEKLITIIDFTVNNIANLIKVYIKRRPNTKVFFCNENANHLGKAQHYMDRMVSLE